MSILIYLMMNLGNSVLVTFHSMMFFVPRGGYLGVTRQLVGIGGIITLCQGLKIRDDVIPVGVFLQLVSQNPTKTN